jgi:hypothetical protein
LAELIDRVQNGEELDENLRNHVCDHLESVAKEDDYGMPSLVRNYYDDIYPVRRRL